MSPTAHGRKQPTGSATEQPLPALSADQLAELLTLVSGADAVELKVSVPDANRRSAVTALDMDPLDAQIRRIVFFDTPDLRLYQHGVVVRARRIQRKPGDSVVKLRPVVPDQLSAQLRKHPGFGVEVDAMPGGFVCSASMKAQVEDQKVAGVMAGRLPVQSLFLRQQRVFLTANAPEGIGLDDLVMLGPINVLKIKFTPPGLGRRLVAELWHYPDGSRILELSTKCAPAEAFLAAAETKAFLAGRGVDLLAPQQTKTKSALEFFAAELSGEATG